MAEPVDPRVARGAIDEMAFTEAAAESDAVGRVLAREDRLDPTIRRSSRRVLPRGSLTHFGRFAHADPSDPHHHGSFGNFADLTDDGTVGVDGRDRNRPWGSSRTPTPTTTPAGSSMIQTAGGDLWVCLPTGRAKRRTADPERLNYAADVSDSDRE